MSLFAVKTALAAAQDWQTTFTLGKVASGMPGIFDFYDSLGNVTINTDTSIPCVLDGPMVVRRYNNLTIDAAAANVTLTTLYRCRGLLLLIDGNLTLQRSASYVASISMTARGARGSAMMGNYDVLIPDSITLAGKGLLQRNILALLKSQGYAIIDRWMWDEWGKYLGVNATAWTGGTVLLTTSGCGAGRNTAGVNGGTAGIAGINGGTGSGGEAGRGNYTTTHVGPGSGSGRSWGGGSGSGGGSANGTSPVDRVGAADDYGGRGGDGTYQLNAANHTGGGAGNPGGRGYDASIGLGSDGTGGVLIIVCKGNITVNAGCIVQADGMNGGTGTGYGGGGGSGGGHVSIIYGGTHTNSGTERANGGSGGSGATPGGAGGAGSVVTKTFAQMGWS